MTMLNDYNPEFMNLALKTASKVDLDIPVCAIIVQDKKIISIETNKKEKENIAVYHAEILSIIEANKKLKNWRLNNCDMYVTLEPCPMCAWAIISSRIKNLYFASYDYKYGAFSGAFNINSFSDYKINVKGGLMEDEGNNLIKNYFKNMRQQNEKILR